MDAQKTKSEQAIKQKYLKEINDFDKQNLHESYKKTLEQILCEYASQTMLLLLQFSEMKDLMPILFSDKERQHRFSCFLKSSFNTAYFTKNNTGQKAELKTLK